MSRKDTIIVAVLLNTGLLAVLFMMAVNVDDDKLGGTTEIQQMAVINPEPPKLVQTETVEIAMTMPVGDQSHATSGDELDNVLKDYAANVPPQTIVLDDDNPDSIEKEQPIEQHEIKKEKVEAKVVANSSSSDKTVDIAVKKGDSLDKIARANGTTVDAIKKASGLKNDKLKIGQVLKVPVGSKKTAAAEKTGTKKEEAKAIASTGPEYYTIKEGDNPWKIAKANKVKFDDLLKLNSLDEDKARNLKAGDKIRVK